MARPPQQIRATDPPPCLRGSGAVALVTVAFLLVLAGPALAGNEGDLILNEFNAVADTDFLRGAVENFVDADVDVTNDEIEINNHLYVDQTGPVTLRTDGTLPTGLLTGTDYYIVTSGIVNTPTEDWIGLSLTPGGSKVDITAAAGGGTHKITLPSDLGDRYFGVVLGNGGNWIELVVVADHVDIRGWKLEWQNIDPDSGSVTFCDDVSPNCDSHGIWSDLRAGTIITIREDDLDPPLGFGDLPTNLSYDPSLGDWWIHVNVDDFNVVTQAGFKVDDDDWRMRILDESSNLIQDWIGEGSFLWGGGGGVANDEVGKLEQDPSAAAATGPPYPAYNDGTSSTFGSENRWMANTMEQDFSELRSVVIRVPSVSGTGLGVLAGVILASAFWVARRRGSAV